MTRVIDAVARKESHVVYYGPGRRIMDVRRQMIDPRRVSAPIFKVPEMPSWVFVGHDFTARVFKAGLTGFGFFLVN